jgi:signal transduction histidine kinase
MTRPAIMRYGAAIIAAAAALATSLILDLYLVGAPVSLFLCAIMFSAWFGGTGPGWLTFGLSHLAFMYYFVSPTHTFVVAVDEIPRLIIFSLSALFVLLLSAAQRRATASLGAARDDLRRAVDELQSSNDALHAENVERERAERALEDLAGRLINAREEERRRIGRELHDHISQTLGVLSIKIDQLRADGDIAPGTGSALDELRRNASEITDDVHRLSHRLHSSTLDYLGLVPALQKLVAEFSQLHDVPITFGHRSVPPSLPSEVALCLFRIAEEALTNIAKHSQAPSANVQVIGAPDGMHLTVEDAGAGFDMAILGSRAGLGFVSMQERLRVHRGTIRVNSAPSRGTRIDAWVPS